MPLSTTSRTLWAVASSTGVIETLGGVLAGSDRPLVITSGTGMGNPALGQLATEDHVNFDHQNPRKFSELAGVSLAERGVNVSVVRLSQTHDPVKQGLITYAVALARNKGVSAYVGDGLNRWPAVHVLDAARLYRLALEKAEVGARYHAVAEEGVPVREIAEVVGRGLKVPVVALSPEEAGEHFGWLALFVGFDMPASSALTQKRLGWRPTGPGSSPISTVCVIPKPDRTVCLAAPVRRRYIVRLDAKKDLISEHPEEHEPVSAESQQAQEKRLQGRPQEIQRRRSQVDSETALDKVIEQFRNQIGRHRIHAHDDQGKRQTALLLHIHDP